MAADNLERVRVLYEGWSRGDWTVGAELFSDDVLVTTFDADGEAIELQGLSALQDWLRDFLRQWRNVRQEYSELLDLGDRVLSIGTQTGAGRASGANVVMPIYNIFVFSGGRVVEFHTTRHEDTARELAGLNAR